MAKKYVYITVDANDGDYVSQLTPLQKKSDLALLEKLASLMEVEGGQWPAQEDDEETPEGKFGHVFSEDEIDTLSWDYFPTTEYGFHTIAEIRLLDISDDFLMFKSR